VLSELCACLCVEGTFWLKISLSRPSYFPVRPASSGSRATIGFVEPQDLRVQTTCALLFFAADEPGSQGKRTTRHPGWKCPPPLSASRKAVGAKEIAPPLTARMARASASEQSPAATVGSRRAGATQTH
jgi:hypothetical protein